MIISWITKEGKASMGKLDDGFEKKLIDFCIQHSVKPLNEQELKQYIPIQFVEPKKEPMTNLEIAVTNNTKIVQRKKHWWQR